jgi:hypothetical protein
MLAPCLYEVVSESNFSQSHQTDCRLLSNREASNFLNTTVEITSRTPPKMTSLHQSPNIQHVNDRESAGEKLKSRWSSNSRVVDRPPSQPPRRRQMSKSPSSSSVEESHHKDPGPSGNSRQGSAVGRLQRRSNSSGGSPEKGNYHKDPGTSSNPRRGSAVGRLQRRNSSCGLPVKESHEKDPDPSGNSRRGSAFGRLQCSNLNLTSGVDSPRPSLSRSCHNPTMKKIPSMFLPIIDLHTVASLSELHDIAIGSQSQH